MANDYSSRRSSGEYGGGARLEPSLSRGRTNRTAPRSGGARPSGSYRSNGGARPQSAGRGYASGGRPAQRSSSGSRAGYSRQGSYSGRGAGYNGNGRRPAPRRRKRSKLPAILAALAAILVLVVVVVLVKPFGSPGGNDAVRASANTGVTTDAGQTGQSGGSNEAVDTAALAQKLADSDTDAGALTPEQMAYVDDLKINTSLPTAWENVLLMGTDERTMNESARTDAMIICSLNRETGEVKLASIMRDLAIDFDDIGKYNGTYRINAANYFGGPKLAVKTVNECFNLNIKYYVLVNFFGFQKIVQRLGGIHVDITQDEMTLINERIKEQYKFAKRAGVDQSDLENYKLETYGENTYLDGRATLAYARLRKLAGGDAMRGERQRIVLSKLLEKAKSLGIMEIASIANDMLPEVQTNLPLNDILTFTTKVLANGLSDVKNMNLPVVGTYSEERRNNDSMLWDCDFAANSIQLYNFIYES